MSKKIKYVRAYLPNINMAESISGPIDGVIDNLNRIRDKGTKDGYRNIEIVLNYSDNDYDYNVDYIGERLETEAECRIREKREKEIAERSKKDKDKIAEQMRVAELHIYKKLHKEFGGKLP